ncbi:hypothetical protein HPB50_026342 [Hyalomma asiaticum]|uniref:Uncharacterized protein n=1 Tax=Hyalomma asiaticum TaxID=266040 RepID=A0ACB7SZY5_HYAAI|nr:hypothetical protein HPB50_026342 [Hyalomma asiaticum]
MFQIFPFAIAAFDADQDGDLDCLTAIRDEYDPEGHFTKYIWIFPGVNGHKRENFTLVLTEGPSPDKLSLNIDDGKPERIAKFGYTDYKTCGVTDIPFKNIETCIMWVTKEALEDIPQNCVHGYEESCDMKLPAFDQETCGTLLANAYFYEELKNTNSISRSHPVAWQVFHISPFAIAAFDSDLDGDLDCLIAIREEYDPEDHFAKYLWVFPDGKPERIATFGYTDYKTCAVTDVPFKNIETCVLWVTKDVLADIPQNCVHGYEESCGIKLPAFDEETCGALLANA